MPKRYLTGGGKPKNLRKSNNYPFRALNNVKNWIKKFARGAGRFLTPRREGELLNSRGVILIEFAVCMPVLIILLFYINDLVKIRRLYSQTEFVGQQIANIIQNISKKRSDKTITLDDLKHACALAWLSASPSSGEAAPYTNIYYVHTGTVSEPYSCPEYHSQQCPEYRYNRIYYCTCEDSNHNHYVYKMSGPGDEECIQKCSSNGYSPYRIDWEEETETVYYDCSYSEDKTCYRTIEADPGKVACAWGIGLNRGQNGTWTKDGDTISSDKSSSTIRWGENADPSAIYPTLTISDNQKKIIVETQFRLDSGDAKKAFGCYLVNPESRVPDGSMYFTSVVTFEPKAGLFTATVPS